MIFSTDVFQTLINECKNIEYPIHN